MVLMCAGIQKRLTQSRKERKGKPKMVSLVSLGDFAALREPPLTLDFYKKYRVLNIVWFRLCRVGFLLAVERNCDMMPTDSQGALL